MAKINYKKMCEMLNIDDKFVKDYLKLNGEERDMKLFEIKSNNIKLNDASTVVDNTKFACVKYGESKYPKYEALNSIACSIYCFIMMNVREAFQNGQMTDEEFVKFFKG